VALSLAHVRGLFATPNARTDLFAPVTQQLRAWPWLCDFQGHVNNARYLDLMTRGRMYLLLQNGLFRPIFTQRMAFLVGGLGGIYRRSIPRMAEFVLQTRVAAYDERWFYYEHTFLLGSRAHDGTAARFLARGQLRAPDGPVAPRESLRRCGLELPDAAPPPPADLEAWSAAQTACLELIKSRDERG
jgi:acyl-CoA thioesterase FadM